MVQGQKGFFRNNNISFPGPMDLAPARLYGKQLARPPCQFSSLDRECCQSVRLTRPQCVQLQAHWAELTTSWECLNCAKLWERVIWPIRKIDQTPPSGPFGASWSFELGRSEHPQGPFGASKRTLSNWTWADRNTHKRIRRRVLFLERRSVLLPTGPAAAAAIRTDRRAALPAATSPPAPIWQVAAGQAFARA